MTHFSHERKSCSRPGVEPGPSEADHYMLGYYQVFIGESPYRRAISGLPHRDRPQEPLDA
jgi:hypothetical protein